MPMYGPEFEDGEGPGGVAGYLDRRSQRAYGNAMRDAMYGAGAMAAGTILAPATQGFSFVPAYGVAGLSLGRGVENAADGFLKDMSADKFRAMPQSPHDAPSRFQPPMKLGGPQPMEGPVDGIDFDSAFEGLQQTLIDIDGDGIPDMVAPQPIQGQTPPQYPPEQPINANAMAEFAGIRSNANAQMKQFQPQQEAPAPTAPQASAPAPSWPGLLNPSKIPGWAASKLPKVSLPDMPAMDNAMTRYAGRSMEGLGRIPGDLVEMGPVDAITGGIQTGSAAFGGVGGLPPVGNAMALARRYPQMTRAAATRNTGAFDDAARASRNRIMDAPAHTLQGRNASGQFQAFDKETRVLRERAKAGWGGRPVRKGYQRGVWPKD